MGLTSRKKRPLNRTELAKRDCRLIIIATEGKETEKQYFNCLLENSATLNTRIQIKILPTGENNQSSPEAVFNRLKSYQDEYALNEQDELWLMIDVDRWGDKKLADIAQKSKQSCFDLAISNPCFEIWLLCHFEMPNDNLSDCNSVEKRLRIVLNRYQKSNLDCTLFTFENITKAIQTAKSLDLKPAARWTPTIGTRVYRLVEKNIVLLRNPINTA